MESAPPYTFPDIVGEVLFSTILQFETSLLTKLTVMPLTDNTPTLEKLPADTANEPTYTDRQAPYELPLLPTLPTIPLLRQSLLVNDDDTLRTAKADADWMP